MKRENSPLAASLLLRHSTGALGILSFSALIAAVGFFGWQSLQLLRYNQAVTELQLDVASTLARGDSQRLLTAFLSENAGELHAASAEYASLRPSKNPQLWAVARYNLAGVYLQQAVHLELAEKKDGRGVLIELAKMHYRRLLADDPSHTDAATNLSWALALQPDVLAPVTADMEQTPERSPQAPFKASGRERLP